MTLRLFRNPILLFLLCFFIFLTTACNPRTSQNRFKLPPTLKEVSGLYLENPQCFWWLNDGGYPPTLYKTNGRGQVTDSLHFPTLKNTDWEDLTSDDEGNIYIGDFGNNLNKRKDLGIYIYHPESRQLDSIFFQYSDQKHFPPTSKDWNFDMEAFFWHNHKLHLFSKNRMGKGGYYCKHYILDEKGVNQTAILNDSIYLKKRVVTAAAISPDGETVALLSYHYKKLLGFLPFSRASIFYFTKFEGNHFLKGKMQKRRAPMFIVATQLESIDFLNNQQLYVASEQTLFIKPKARRVRVRTK